MCQCNMIADGEFSPIHIESNKMQFCYIDGFGKRHVLIESFNMKITASKASVSEVLDDNGKVVAYQFVVASGKDKDDEKIAATPINKIVDSWYSVTNKPSPDWSIVSNQHGLGQEFEKILYENVWNLCEE